MLMSAHEHKRKGRKKELLITCEILAPGTLKRKVPDEKNLADRWEDIIEICAAVIEEELK